MDSAHVPSHNDVSCKHIAAIIPALNERENIQSIVRSLNRRALVVVVDDGSSDDTARLAALAGAHVVIHQRNLGYDRALETGLKTVAELCCSYAVTLDADRQHDPALLDEFLFELDNGADLVIGQRDYMQRWAERLFGIVAGRLWKIEDPLCGMMGYNLEFLKKIGIASTYESIGTELMLKGLALKAKHKTIRIKTKPRAGTSRFGDGLKANLKICKALLFAVIKIKFNLNGNYRSLHRAKN